MVSDWLETTLSKVILTNHQSYSKNDNWSFINYLDTGNITENNISDVQYLKVGIDKIPSRAKRKVDSGDIIYSTVRPNQKHFGILRNPLDNMLVSTGFTTIRCKSAEADTNFIYWFLVQPQIIEHLQSIGEQSASAYPSIKPSDIESLDIRLPPIEEQKVIAHILGSLDDKIELNRQMNETLEAMAQALFKSWFVDFDPVIDNALAAGNPIPDEFAERAEQRKAIKKKDHSDIQSLFPDEFEFTEEMGWIPKGWENGILADICSYGKGKINTSELTLENYVSTENMNKEKSGISHAANIASTNQVPKFSVGQTLISNIRPYFKKIWLASFSGGRSNDVLSFQAHKSVANEYLFNLLYQDSFFDYMTATSKGTKMPRGDKAAIMSWSVAIPSSKLMEEFSELAKPVYLANNLRSLQTIELAKLRDTLLPKLMSGELRIPDADAMTKEV